MPHEVVEVELVLRDLLGNTPCFLFVILLLRALNERNDVTHTENTIRHTGRVKDVKRLHFLACSDELDRFIDYRTDRERRTTTCIAVEFGQYDAVKVNAVIELLGGVDCILTGHGIDHEEGLGGLNSLFDRCYLLHHLLIHGKTSGGIDDHHVVAELAGFGDGVLRFLHRVRFVLSGINFGVDLLTEDA